MLVNLVSSLCNNLQYFVLSILLFCMCVYTVHNKTIKNNNIFHQRLVWILLILLGNYIQVNIFKTFQSSQWKTRYKISWHSAFRPYFLDRMDGWSSPSITIDLECQRRRLNTEERAKVVDALGGTELIQFLATLPILHQDDLK